MDLKLLSMNWKFTYRYIEYSFEVRTKSQLTFEVHTST